MYLWLVNSSVTDMLAVVTLGLGLRLAKLYWINRVGVSPFEWSFNSESETRTPITPRLFMLAVVILIFDVQLVLVFPVLHSVYNTLFDGEGVCVLWSLGNMLLIVVL